jgi:hypothetical protein
MPTQILPFVRDKVKKYLPCKLKEHNPKPQ